MPVSRFFAVLICIVTALPAWSSWPLADAEGRELPSLAPLVKQVNPAVVNISTFTTRTVQQNPLLNDPFFRRFFDLPPGHGGPRQHRAQSAGSGVIIDDDEGLVVTNHHVIDGADDIEVGLEDGRSFKAELIGSDPDVDIAVLKIDADDIKALRLGNSDQLEQGDFVVALGNPFGLNHTVTTGVVSALARTGLGIEGYESFIQTDADINPGNSGGALVNLRGELVGINTAILSRSGGSMGIGFAIPINMARTSIDQIVEHGEVRRGQLGVIIQNLTPELAEAFDLDTHQRGVVIAEVQPDSAADEAGLKAGDIVISVDGKEMEHSAQLRNEIGGRRIGEELEITVLRDGKTKVIEAEVGEPAMGVASKERLHKFLDGAALKNAQNGKGVLVAEIERGSAAARSGLRPGDVIVAANKKNVSDIKELKNAVKGNGDKLLLRVIRGKVALYIVLQ